MKISDVYSAKGLKIKFQYEDASVPFVKDALLRIEATQKEREFLLQQYGTNQDKKVVLAKTNAQSAAYLIDLFDGENQKAFKCVFSIEDVSDHHIAVQSYTFRTLTSYKTPIYIQVPSNVLKKITLERLQSEFIWTQLGDPALFCLNYKNKKKQIDHIRFVSGNHYLYTQNTPRGIVIEGISYLKDRYVVPIDIYMAPEIKFVEESDSILANEGFSAALDEISNSASYLARWEAYNTLSKKLLNKEREEFGEIAYTRYEEKPDLTGITYIFDIKEELDETFIGKELCTKEKDKAGVKAVGAIKRVSKNQIITYKESIDEVYLLPTSGVLELFQMGDLSIMARRDAARKRMSDHLTPIKSLDALIEAGATQIETPGSWGSYEAVTEMFRRNFRKADSLNDKQKKAIEIAINTPDIALVQGPPGTGKTTVIKAICERFREIYESEEQRKLKEDDEHQLQSPKILISSFQNEAVDNAISTPLPGDIPAYRKMAKRSKDSSHDQYQKTLDKWYMGLKSAIAGSIKSQEANEYIAHKSELEDEYISYKNSGENLYKAAGIIKRYLSFMLIEYPEELVSTANKIIRAANGDDNNDIPDPLVAKLESQRLEKGSFEDDGIRNAMRLAAHLKVREDLVIEDKTLEIIDKVCYIEHTEKDFNDYVQLIKGLKKVYCNHKTAVDVKDKTIVNECILKMGQCFNRQYMNMLSDIDDKKSLILSEFLVRLDQEYESIVGKYSMTTAATCQASLDLRKSEKIFDLVIVDEAARANPLDLFIPMSMGKKIILVGDHKQLPHMLEPDVLKTILDDPQFKDLDEIEKSLFERMYGIFSKGNKPKAVLLTNQYRMHPDICSFVSDEFYDGELKTDSTITPELRASPLKINNGRALTLVNIPTSRGTETTGPSKSRMVELESLCSDIKNILNIGKDTTVGVITFYASQALKIKERLDLLLNDEEKRQVEVGTVDAFQGKEFDYVMLSCVRSNYPKGKGDKRNVGFLDRPNRLCVAFSRAMRQLIVYCDMDTLIEIPCFERLYKICAIEGGGCYREY